MGMQNILDTPSTDQRQHLAENSAQCPRGNSTPAGTGNLSDTSSQLDARKPAHISSPTPASGGSVRSARPSHPPAGSDDYQRQRDNDHPAATWCSDRGEFVQTTGPPLSTCRLYP